MSELGEMTAPAAASGRQQADASPTVRPPQTGAERGAVVVVGSVNVDYVLHVSRRPEGGETVAAARLELHPGGKGANQSVAVARLGAGVELIARVGDDAAGRGRVAELRAEGVGVALVSPTSGVPTGTAVILLTPDGENSIVVAPGANAALRAEDLDVGGGALDDAAVVLMQLEVPLAVVARAAELAGPATTVVLNAAPYRELPPELLARVDVLVVNQSEAGALVGRRVEGVEAARAVAAECRRLGPRAVVVTLGAEGAVAAGDGLELHVPAPPTEVVDTTGAGDAFVGALAARLAAGRPLEDAVRVGVRVGSATAAHLGATPQLPPELLAELGRAGGEEPRRRRR